MSEEANKDCCRCLQDAKVAAIKAELAAAAAKADDVLIVFDTKIIIQDNIQITHTPCKITVGKGTSQNTYFSHWSIPKKVLFYRFVAEFTFLFCTQMSV